MWWESVFLATAGRSSQMTTNIETWKSHIMTKARKFTMGKELNRAVMRALPFHDHRSSPVKCRFYATEDEDENQLGDYRCRISCTIGEDKYTETSIDQNFETAWKTCVEFISSKLTRRKGKNRKKKLIVPMRKLSKSLYPVGFL